MFSLIITIISIALVAALAVATLYYGGDAFTEGTTQANASAIINQAQQIGGAATLFTVQNAGEHPDVISNPGTDEKGLVEENYLDGSPSLPEKATDGAAWAMASGTVADANSGHIVIDAGNSGAVNSNVCAAINEEAGIDPSNSDAVALGGTTEPLTVTVNPSGTATTKTLPFACDTAATNPGSFAYGY